MIRNLLSAFIVIAVCSASADAVVRTRTFELEDTSTNGFVTSTVGAASFTYDTDDIGSTIPFSSGFSVMTDDSRFTSQTFDLQTISYLGTALRFEFENGTPGEFLRLRIPSGSGIVFGSGNDIPDVPGLPFNVTGTDFPGPGAPGGNSSLGDTVRIGTAAIPEPSAFAFGALGLAVTGFGRWVRRRLAA